MAILELFASVGNFIIEHIGTFILILVFSALVTFFVVGISIEGSEQINQSWIPHNGLDILNNIKNGFMGLMGLQ